MIQYRDQGLKLLLSAVTYTCLIHRLYVDVHGTGTITVEIVSSLTIRQQSE
jgi:hypothetical protein